jgi:PAS domain S-box-containing protein
MALPDDAPSNSSTSDQTDPSPPWLLAKGETGRAIAAFPWGRTPLGELLAWPSHLRLAVNLMLGAGAPMALIWGPDYRLLYNDRYAEIIQDKHPAALGAPAGETFAEVWSVIAPLFRRAMSGEAVLIEDLELNVTRQGRAEAAYFSFSYNPIAHEAGRVDGFLAVVVETTRRVLEERERARVFDTVLSTISDFAYTFDREGRITYANKSLLELWGLPLDQALGKNVFDLRYPDGIARKIQRDIAKVFAERRQVRGEVHYVSPTGVDGYFEHILSPVLAADGSVDMVAGSTRDVTGRRKLEMEALAASQAKDDFIATLSHELRTPLNPVLLLATESAADPALPAAVRSDFQTIADNISLEARLIDDLLDVSRITHHKLQLDLRTQDVHPLLRQAMTSVEAEFRSKRLQLVARLEAEPSTVSGDSVRLQQVFWNLLQNAVKFTPAGGTITVRTSVPPGQSASLRIEIADTGIGLTAGELAAVFKPFAQGDHMHERNARYGGLGLGLALARRIAELHSGRLSAASPGRDQGAVFTVELPLAQPDPPDKPLTADVPPVAASGRSAAAAGLRVLLVEDHESSRLAVAHLLTNRKIAVVLASSAAEALEVARIKPVDLVISDIGLPESDGYELMRKLRTAYGYTGIALSGYGTQNDIDRSRNAGFMLHLTKPVQAKALDMAIALYLVHRAK